MDNASTDTKTGVSQVPFWQVKLGDLFIPGPTDEAMRVAFKDDSDPQLGPRLGWRAPWGTAWVHYPLGVDVTVPAQVSA